MFKNRIRLSPMQMFGISALLLAFDFLMLIAFIGQAPTDTVERDNWDFRIAELRQVDSVEPTTAVAGVAVERDTPESEPRDIDTQPTTTPSLSADREIVRQEIREWINFGFNQYLEDSDRSRPFPYWPSRN